MASAPEIHFEPFLHLVDVGAEEVLIAWGGFYFRRGDSSYGEWRIVDDEELREVAGHLLLIDLDDERALVHPIAGVTDDGTLEEIELRRPDGGRLSGPIEIPAS